MKVKKVLWTIAIVGSWQTNYSISHANTHKHTHTDWYWCANLISRLTVHYSIRGDKPWHGMAENAAKRFRTSSSPAVPAHMQTVMQWCIAVWLYCCKDSLFGEPLLKVPMKYSRVQFSEQGYFQASTSTLYSYIYIHTYKYTYMYTYIIEPKALYKRT